MPEFGRDDLARVVGDVSRETAERLDRFHILLGDWNSRINLVSPDSYKEAWRRHFADSAQLWRLGCGRTGLWLDLGSGGGFPGLVIAILAEELNENTHVELVESDLRKAAFLRRVREACGLSVAVHDRRIEDLAPARADVLSARALAPLTALLGHADRHLAPDGIALFPKGRSVHKEIEDAARTWRFEPTLHRSQFDEAAAIVMTGKPVRVG